MGTTPWDNGPVTVDEKYQTAIETSDLTVGGGMIPKDYRSGAGEVIGAAGYGVGLGISAKATGMALLRLHGEWASSAKPRRVGRTVIDKLAEVIKAQDDRDRKTAQREGTPYAAPRSATRRAADETQRWYTNELRILSTSLKSRPAVVSQLNAWATMKGIDGDAVGSALHYWLNETCPVCEGHGFLKIPDQPSLSAKRCTACHGTGRTEMPHGAGRVLKHIEYCLDQARGQLRDRLKKY